MNIRLPRVLWLGLALCTWCCAALARPAADEPMNGQILQRQDLPYRFEQHNLDSADGQRHYRLWVGIPRRTAPAVGYPVAYLLDGNAAIGALDEGLLQQLELGNPPLLVAIGTDTALRIDRAARTYDYTFKRDVPEQRDPLTGEASGGAEAFLDLLQQRIKPLIASHYPVDNRRQLLWGHSYGGLLVLHALLTRPGSFQTYAAASPSFWWGDGAILDQQAGFARRFKGHTAQLLLMRGDQEPAAHPRAAAGRVGPGTAEQFARSMAANAGLKVHYQLFPGLSHGPMLPESLGYTLRALAR